MKRKIIICILLVSAGAAFGVREKLHHTEVFSAQGLSFINVSSHKDSSGADVFRLKDVSYEQNPDPLLTDIVFSFKNKAMEKSSDDTGRYPVDYASYEISKDIQTAGESAALFYKQDHRIEVAPRNNLWLSSHSDLGSFTIEMRVNPLTVREGAVLFSRVGFLSGSRNGIEIRFSGGRICAYFYGIFAEESGERKDFALTRGTRLATGRWAHYALSYDRLSGKCAQFINGREDDVIFITDTGRAFEGALRPSFAPGDMPLTVIGKNYSGYLDEFRIAYRYYDDLKKVSDTAERRYRELQVYGRTPVNREGIISSSVKEFPYTGTMIEQFAWDVSRDDKTFAYCEIRISDLKFRAEDRQLKWYRIENNQRGIWQMKADDGFLRGKYFQWRMHLIPSPDGESTPEIKNIRISYEIDNAPEIPGAVEVISAGDGFITLRWRKNVDFDIAGYKIYYGVRSGKYDGVLRRVQGKPLSNELSASNYITMTINNDLIEENRLIDGGHVLEYPVLKNNVYYFFAVSAYDAYKPDSSLNHESRLSKETGGRPWAGSEIR